VTTRARDHTEAVGMATLVAVGEGSVVGEGSTLAVVVVEVLEEVQEIKHFNHVKSLLVNA